MKEDAYMGEFRRFLDFQKDVAEATTEIIRKYQGDSNGSEKPVAERKRTYKLRIVEDILRKAGRPLHISEIIRIAQQHYQVEMERDSIVSALVKKINAGDTFVRTAPNTFTLL
jgi:hypothetical protein